VLLVIFGCTVVSVEFGVLTDVQTTFWDCCEHSCIQHIRQCLHSAI